MKVAAKINAEQRNGNLHISVHGRFTPSTAAQLTLLMGKASRMVENVIIHTDDISRISARSKSTFRRLIDLLELPRNTMYFFGKNGPALCSNRKQIILYEQRKTIRLAAPKYVMDICEDDSSRDFDSLREGQVQLNRYQIT